MFAPCQVSDWNHDQLFIKQRIDSIAVSNAQKQQDIAGSSTATQV